MLRDLISTLPATDSDLVDAKTPMRFKNAADFVTPEALILHEQKIISDERIKEACERAYNCILYEPMYSYVPREIIELFWDLPVVVIQFSAADSAILLGTIPEYRAVQNTIFSDKYTIKFVYIPIYYYVELYERQYGSPDFLVELTTKDKWDFIIQEALELNAADITVTNTSRGAQVYYNVRKKKIQSKRFLRSEDVQELIHMLSGQSKATIAEDNAIPRYFAITINKNNVGRAVVNRTLYGWLLTVRVLSTNIYNKSLEDLNLKSGTCTFIREVMLSQEKGLRLFIGETMSGKNTTIVTALKELVNKGIYKVVSVEQPVEIPVDGIEQINTTSDEEFEKNADSLLRQNPDIVYFTEITARTAKSIMQQANTAKAVFSTVHANSISQVLFRLQDITQMPMDRLVLTLHSCVYQELVRDDRLDVVYPYTRCVYFDENLKMELYGKSIKEVVGILSGVESRWKET